MQVNFDEHNLNNSSYHNGGCNELGNQSNDQNTDTDTDTDTDTAREIFNRLTKLYNCY